MDYIQTLEQLCGICETLIGIVKAQQLALAQMGAVVAEEEIEKARSEYAALLGTADRDGN